MSTGKSVFITGASTGIGLNTAFYLADRGWRVFAGVRKINDAERITEESRGAITPVIADVTDETSLAQARKKIETCLNGLAMDALVNNAGIVVSGPLEFLPGRDLQRQFEVNVAGVMNTTREFLPLLRLAKGRIINIGSISGLVAYPFLGPYAMSKYALEALNDSLRIELASSGISVCLIEPGVIKTPIWEKSRKANADALQSLPVEAANLYGRPMKNFNASISRIEKLAMPAEKISKTIQLALDSKHPRTRYLIGLDAKLQYWTKAILPEIIFDRIVQKVMRL